MERQGTKTLESDKLILRKFRIDDAQAMYENWANDSEVTKYLPWSTHETVEISKNVINYWMSQYCMDDFYQWAITIKENGDFPIGSFRSVLSVLYTKKTA